MGRLFPSRLPGIALLHGDGRCMGRMSCAPETLQGLRYTSRWQDSPLPKIERDERN